MSPFGISTAFKDDVLHALTPFSGGKAPSRLHWAREPRLISTEMKLLRAVSDAEDAVAHDAIEKIGGIAQDSEFETTEV